MEYAPMPGADKNYIIKNVAPTDEDNKIKRYGLQVVGVCVSIIYLYLSIYISVV